MKNRIATRLTLTLLALGLASPALATDGVLEINQTCAVNTGCFSGDTAGFPVTIDATAGRSYRLTSDLTVPDEDTGGIVVSTNDISIDLNGFAIIGPVTCSETPLTCSHASGNGSGISQTSSSFRGTSVKNGSITGMRYGVLLGDQAEVKDLRVRWNRLVGIYAEDGSTVSGNSAYENGGHGIYAANGSTISGNTAYNNGDNGISANSASTVSGNTVRYNGDLGIHAGFASTVSGNTVTGSILDGIRANSASTVIGNMVSGNGGDGIDAGAGSTVMGNTAYGNTGYGLQLDVTLRAGYRDNVIDSNAAGTVSGGIQNGKNVCNGSTTCP